MNLLWSLSPLTFAISSIWGLFSSRSHPHSQSIFESLIRCYFLQETTPDTLGSYLVYLSNTLMASPSYLVIALKPLFWSLTPAQPLGCKLVGMNYFGILHIVPNAWHYWVYNGLSKSEEGKGGRNGRREEKWMIHIIKTMNPWGSKMLSKAGW